MRQLYFSLFLIACGFVLGWLGRSYDLDRSTRESQGQTTRDQNPLFVGQERSSTVSTLRDETTQTTFDPRAGRSTSRELSAGDQTPTQTVNIQSIPAVDTENFKRLLKEKRFDEAMQVYRQLDLGGDGSVPGLRVDILSYLDKFLDIGNQEDFSALANSYLSHYYNDIDVILLIAKSHQQADYFIEAVNMYQLANEYALSWAEDQKVRQAFDRFLREVDQYLHSQQQWYMLRQLYERAERVGLLDPLQTVRMAEVIALTGEPENAREILATLIARNQATSRAKQALANLGENIPGDVQRTSFEGEVALTRHGDHFIVPVLWPSASRPAQLLLDTGASLTTLTFEAFQTIAAQADYEHVGSRMFHTASGISKGDIYRFSQLQLGSFQLQNVDIAVLDFPMADNVHGLLGMNILGKFRFHIDQQNAVLELTPFSTR